MCENGNDTYDNCTTRFYQEQMRQNCGCLPYSVIEHNEACINISINKRRCPCVCVHVRSFDNQISGSEATLI